MSWGRKAGNLHETRWVFTGGEKAQPANTYVRTCVRVSEFALITREPKIPFLFIFLFLLPIRPRRRCLRVQIHLTVKADLSVAQALKWEKGGNNPKVTKILLQSLLVVS